MSPLFVLLLATPALACGPGTGRLGATAVFNYQIVPPIIYTFSDSPSQGQINQQVATSLAKNDITDAVTSVLTTNGIPTTNVQITVVSDVLNTPLVSTCPTTAGTTKSYETFNNLVYYLCNGESAKTAFTANQQITVVAPQSIYESQWNVLSTQIQQQLTSKRNTQFLSGIVTVQ